jgi:hypothetical protein
MGDLGGDGFGCRESSNQVRLRTLKERKAYEENS